MTSSSTGKILLTGGTGFIGGELLRRLLRRDTRSVICLVRAATRREADLRGEKTLRDVLGREPSARTRARVEWVQADIERPRLGLDDATFARLAAETEEVFHCAASTAFDLPYDEARRVNVVGVEAMVELCEAAVAHGRFRRLNHVSTAYSSGYGQGRRAVGAENLPGDDAAEYRNSYERTKAEAERFLRARMDRIPISVFRPSIVVGDSRTGKTSSWNVCYYPMRLMAWGRLPFASVGGRALLDIVPVDYVCDAMLALSKRADAVGQTYHLTAGERAFTVHDVIRHTYAGMARRTGGPVEVKTWALGPFAWACVSAALRLFGSEKARKALDGFDVYVDYTRVDVVFDAAREAALLAEAGVPQPDPERYFPRIVEYALAENFGRERPKSAPAPVVAAAQLERLVQMASGFHSTSGQLAGAAC